MGHKKRFDNLLAAAIRPKRDHAYNATAEDTVRAMQARGMRYVFSESDLASCSETVTGLPPDAPASTDTISGTPEELERKSRGPFSGL